MSDNITDVVTDVDTKKAKSSLQDRAAWSGVFHMFQDPKALFAFKGPIESPSIIVVNPTLEEMPWEPPAAAQVASREIVLPFDTPGVIGDEKRYLATLPPGLTIITGATASGKTTFARGLVKTGAFVRLQTVEPYDDPADIGDSPIYTSLERALVAAIITAATNQAVPIIDSLRALLFEIGGASGTKGVSTRFFTQLTRVSIDLARNGITVLATVNPTEDDPAFVDNFIQKLAAAVPMLLHVQSTNGNKGAREVVGRLIKRPERTWHQFVWRQEHEKPGSVEVVDVVVAPYANDLWERNDVRSVNPTDVLTLTKE